MSELTEAQKNFTGTVDPREPDQEHEDLEPSGAEGEELDTCPSLAPPWMATFSDLGTLLMAFFVLILARSVVDSPRMETVMGSVALAFGV